MQGSIIWTKPSKSLYLSTAKIFTHPAAKLFTQAEGVLAKLFTHPTAKLFTHPWVCGNDL
jgi:hypothetical protein